MAIFTPCLHMWCSLSICLRPNLLLQGDQSFWIGLTLMTSFWLNYLWKDSVSKYTHILRYWALGLQHTNLVHSNSPCFYPLIFSSCWKIQSLPLLISLTDQVRGKQDALTHTIFQHPNPIAVSPSIRSGIPSPQNTRGTLSPKLTFLLPLDTS